MKGTVILILQIKILWFREIKSLAYVSKSRETKVSILHVTREEIPPIRRTRVIHSFIKQRT